MSSFVEDVLYQVASSTFEELGFFLPDRDLNEHQRTSAAEAVASVEFHGPVAGRLVIRLHAELLPVLAMNMLGETEPPSLVLQRDALGEMANVICGNVLPQLAGAGAAFRLDAPRAEEPRSCVAPADAHAYEAVLGLDEGRAEVLLITAAPLPRSGAA